MTLLHSLVRASAELQAAHDKARAAGREDICQMLRKAQWQVVAALSDIVPDRVVEVVS